MIVGNGDIASVLGEIDRDDRIYFASGVSFSGETRESEYQREIDLLLTQDKSKHLVYFGSMCIFYNDSRYTTHKKHIEDLIKIYFPHYTIIRLGLITWGTNPNTLINHFKNKIKNGEPLEIKDVVRYVIEKDEFLYWMSIIPEWNCEMNCPGRIMTVQEIVDKYVL